MEILLEEWRKAYGQAYALTGNSADAEDAVQETYLRLFQADQNKIESTAAWMRGVLRNVVFIAYHKLKPDRYTSLAVTDEHGEEFGDTLEADEDIEARVIEESLVRKSLHVLSTLTDKERECVMMYARGCSFVQISASLGISYKVALTTTRKTLIKVRAELEA